MPKYLLSDISEINIWIPLPIFLAELLLNLSQIVQQFHLLANFICWQIDYLLKHFHQLYSWKEGDDFLKNDLLLLKLQWLLEAQLGLWLYPAWQLFVSVVFV